MVRNKCLTSAARFSEQVCILGMASTIYLGLWDVSLDPIKQTVLTEIHIMQSNIANNCSGGGGGNSYSTWMAAVVISITHKHTFRFKEQSILTSI